jgi:hypothetical protein
MRIRLVLHLPWSTVLDGAIQVLPLELTRFRGHGLLCG